MDYSWWNERLAEQVFRTEFAGQPVFLYITDEVLEEIGQTAKVGREDFLASIRAGPPGASEIGHCLRALEVARHWRSKGHKWPPYLAYLAVFSLAVGLEGDFPPHAYYNRLRKLLDEPPGYTLPHFERMHILWRDLEEWSNKDRGGNIGIFTVRTVGKWAHVGIPKAQSLLTEHERRRLPEIFSAADLDPRSPPTDGHLSHCLLKHGHGRLRARTLKLVGGAVGTDSEMRATLLEILADELRRWDGTTPALEADESRPLISEVERQARETLRNAQKRRGDEPKADRVTGYLRICCEFDRVRRLAATFMRCTFSAEFPEGEFRLYEDRASQTAFRCEEELPGWSSYLARADTGTRIPASAFDWSEGKKLIIEGLGWIVSLPPSDVRIFVDGSPSGLQGLVEVRRLPRADPFYVASNRSCTDEVLSWARKSCANLTEFGELDGFPEGWSFFGARGVLDDSPVREKFPILSLPSATRLFFEGGIKSARGNSFFWFCAPRIALETDDPAITLYCNGMPAAKSQGENIYDVPILAPGKATVNVEAKRGEDIVAAKAIYLEDTKPVILHEAVAFDMDGQPLESTSASRTWFSGARTSPGGKPFDLAEAIAPRVDARRVFAIGRLVGQIEKLSRGRLREGWKTIWHVSLARKGVAHYCGTDLEADRPSSERVGHRKNERLWRDVLWHSRKVITPPIHPALRRLWLEYQEVARDA